MSPPPPNDAIYLDHAATTPVDPAVVEAMLPYFTERFGNPSSIYQLGQESRSALDRSRAAIASVLGCRPSEIVFTSGATEADNLALSGVAWHHRLGASQGNRSHIVTTAIEHSAVLATARWLERQGFDVTYVQCDKEGLVPVEEVAAALKPETCLISVTYANNEVGSIQPIREIGALARDRGIPFHTDAVQAAGSLPLRVDDLNVDLLTLAAHKFYGPKGVGLLYVRKQTPIAYQQHGGGQESGRRGGTENVPLVVGMAVALDQAERGRSGYNAHCATLRDRLLDGLRSAIPEVALNGPAVLGRRLANNANVSLPGIQGETVLLSLDMQGIAASAGSACSVGNSQPSHVLQAMGLNDERIRSSLRFTVGWSNTPQQIDETVDVLVETVERERSLAGVA